METNNNPNATGVQLSELFQPEFFEFTKQLKAINKWFYDYRKTVNQADDHIVERLIEIDNNLSDVVNNIADLVAIEFKENVYYKD